MTRQTLVSAISVFFAPAVFAGMPNGIPFVPQAIPAIGEAGLIGAAIALGIIGAKFITKFKK